MKEYISIWKLGYGGMVVSEAKRLRALKEKNVKLKKPLAKAVRNNAAPRGLA
ncbi:MAG: hypothetical protein AB1781_03105 [Pseudomonadota bacterium]